MSIHTKPVPERVRGLRTVLIRKDALLEKVRANREEHVKIYEKALEGYHEAIIDGLRRQIEEANAAHQEAIEHLEKQVADLTAHDQARIERLQKALDDAEAGRAYVADLPYIKPTDHSVEYDLIIAALEMSLDDELELPIEDFGRAALDRWPWSGTFLSASSEYSEAARSKLERLEQARLGDFTS